jgi:cell shape-determining protein MreD
MLLDPRALIMLGANALLLYLTQLVNSATAAWPVYFFLLGPMVVLPALYLRHQSYFICTFLTGLWVDASMGVPFGFFTTLFLLVGAIIFSIRIRFRAEHNYHPILLAHGINFFLLLVLTLVTGREHFGVMNFWIQVLVTSFCSHLALLFVAPWFYNLERQLFEICRLETEPEDLPLL